MKKNFLFGLATGLIMMFVLANDAAAQGGNAPLATITTLEIVEVADIYDDFGNLDEHVKVKILVTANIVNNQPGGYIELRSAERGKDNTTLWRWQDGETGVKQKIIWHTQLRNTNNQYQCEVEMWGKGPNSPEQFLDIEFIDYGYEQ